MQNICQRPKGVTFIWQALYLSEADLPLEVLDVGLLVEGDLRHVAEEAPQLQAAQLHRRIQVQRGGVKVPPEVVASDLGIVADGLDVKTF